jgi:hypothetical protein
MRINWIVCVMAVMALCVTGCSKAPQAEIDEAKAALEQAAVAEADVYAAEQYAAAEDAMKRLEAELTVQEEKSSLFRRYGTAKELVAEVTTASEAAATAAVSGKAQVQAEATDAIAATRELLAEVQQMLAKAPTGKGTKADLAAMKADLEGVATALDEADATLAAGGFMQAKTGADAAREVLEQVQADITAAIEARRAARR